MATARGEAPVRRRRGRGRKQPSTPVEIGLQLQRAREALGLGLVDVRDRSGVPLGVLEALEAGTVSALANHDAVLVSLRRYADLVGLDGEAMARSLAVTWPEAALVGAGAGWGQTAAVGVAGQATATGTVPAATGGFAGHLRQYPGQGTHLQAFTQTAPVPSVRSATGTAGAAGAVTGGDPYGSGQVFGTTGMYPATPPLRIRQVVRPAAWPVRLLVWIAAGALVAAGAGLGLAHARPQWMRDIHLARVPDAAALATGGAPGPSSGATHSSAPSSTAPKNRSVVTVGMPDAAGTPITVRAAQYTVLVQTLGRCWIQAGVPGASAPFLNTVLPAGAKQVLTPVGGQLTVDLGASGVFVDVQVGGKTVPGFTYTPTSAPITLNFSNTPTATSSP